MSFRNSVIFRWFQAICLVVGLSVSCCTHSSGNEIFEIYNVKLEQRTATQHSDNAKSFLLIHRIAGDSSALYFFTLTKEQSEKGIDQLNANFYGQLFLHIAQSKSGISVRQARRNVAINYEVPIIGLEYSLSKLFYEQLKKNDIEPREDPKVPRALFFDSKNKVSYNGFEYLVSAIFQENLDPNDTPDQSPNAELGETAEKTQPSETKNKNLGQESVETEEEPNQPPRLMFAKIAFSKKNTKSLDESLSLMTITRLAFPELQRQVVGLFMDQKVIELESKERSNVWAADSQRGKN